MIKNAVLEDLLQGKTEDLPDDIVKAVNEKFWELISKEDSMSMAWEDYDKAVGVDVMGIVKEAVKKWFRKVYVNPNEACPVDAGEFVYLGGGPYTTLDELSSEFSGIVDGDFLAEIAEEIEAEADDVSQWDKEIGLYELYLRAEEQAKKKDSSR